MNKKDRFFKILIFFIPLFLFTTCQKDYIPNYRINLDKNWQYSLQGEPYPFYELPDNDLSNLSNFLENKIGYIFIKTTFTIPEKYKYMDVGLNIGRIKIASKIYINNHAIGKTGTFPPHEFTEGNRTFAFSIPKDYLNIGGENTLMICLWCHGYGTIDSVPFISEYSDVQSFEEYYSFVYSKMYLILTIILLIITLIYFFLFILRRTEYENLTFSLLCLFTAIYLSVFYFGEYDFLGKRYITYLMFEKVFKGATALLTGYMIVCFTRDFLHYQEPFRGKIGRLLITVAGIIIPFTASNIPDFRSRLRIGFFFIIFQFIFLGKVIFTALIKKEKRLVHLIVCLIPFLLAFTSQIIAKVFFKQKIDTLFLAISWIAVIFLFLGSLIIHFVQLANEVEYMNKNLEQIVTDRTEALEKERNRAIKEIDLAGFVQRSFYKLDTSEVKDWEIQITSKAMTGVSGDLYIAIITENHLDGIGIFDISGHGIASGLVTMLVKNIIEKEFRKGKSIPLNEVMTKINNRIILEKGSIENYLTGMLIRFNKEDIELVNAGHPKAILYDSNTGNISNVENEGVNQYGAIGIADFPISFETVHFHMNKNDELVLYTDGITECYNDKKQYFGSEGIFKVFKQNINQPVQNQVEALPAALKDFSGSEKFTDDITYIILKKLV